MPRILLSVPQVGTAEQACASEAFRTNRVSTAGPNLNAFEEAMFRRIGIPAVCLASGTAAIHLGLRSLGAGRGDEVFCPTLTFAGSANPIRNEAATPVFIDSDRGTWNMDPGLLARALRKKARENRLPKAVIMVHLYGQCADMDPILEICAEFGVPVLEDAAEALGATYKGRPAGTMGATKRVAELVVRAFQPMNGRYVSVRFGNVLGSNGSVPTGSASLDDGQRRRGFRAGYGQAGEDCGPGPEPDSAFGTAAVCGHQDRVLRGAGGGETVRRAERAEEGLLQTHHEKISVFAGATRPKHEIEAHLREFRRHCVNRDPEQLMSQRKALVTEYAPGQPRAVQAVSSI